LKCGNNASCRHVNTKVRIFSVGMLYSHHWQLDLHCFSDLLTQWHAVQFSLDAMRVASTKVSGPSIVLTWMSNPTTRMQLGFLLTGWQVFDLTLVSVRITDGTDSNPYRPRPWFDQKKKTMKIKKEKLCYEIRTVNSQNISDEPYRFKQLAWYYVLVARHKEAAPRVWSLTLFLHSAPTA